MTDRLFVILGHFLPFQPPDDLENKNFEKLKKIAGYIIILHICTINDNHMMYGSQGFPQISISPTENLPILPAPRKILPPVDSSPPNFYSAPPPIKFLAVVIAPVAFLF